MRRSLYGRDVTEQVEDRDEKIRLLRRDITDASQRALDANTEVHTSVALMFIYYN